jgi:hypothetical protein
MTLAICLPSKLAPSDVAPDTILAGTPTAATRTEDEVGLENLGPWDDFERGMLNGKLSPNCDKTHSVKLR